MSEPRREAYVEVVPELLSRLHDHPDVEVVSFSYSGDGYCLCLVASPLLPLPGMNGTFSVVLDGDGIRFKRDVDT